MSVKQLAAALSGLGLALRGLAIETQLSASDRRAMTPTQTKSHKLPESTNGSPLSPVSFHVKRVGARKCHPQLWPKMIRTLTPGSVTTSVSIEDVL